MIRDTMISISEALFWVMGGVPIAETLWILPWIVMGAFLMAAPMFVPIWIKSVRLMRYASLMFLLLFFPTLLLTIGPPIVQISMLTECTPEQETATVDTEHVQDVIVYLDQCRNKDNYYDTEYNPWFAFQVEKHRQ